jgi:hypothetical protein
MITKIDYKKLNKQLQDMYMDDALEIIAKRFNKMIKEINEALEKIEGVKK